MPVFEVEVLFVPALEQRRARVQEVENAADAEDIAGLSVTGEALLVLEDLGRHEAQGAAAVVVDVLLSQLLLPDGEAQVRQVQRGVGLLGSEEDVLRLQVPVDVAYVDEG